LFFHTVNVVMQMEKYPRIRNLREDSDLAQQQVGEAINVPQRTYACCESGQRMIPPHVLCALADFYKVSVDYLLERTDKKN
jgi:transcriptional regulator with XRE-family HTH domain